MYNSHNKTMKINLIKSFYFSQINYIRLEYEITLKFLKNLHTDALKYLARAMHGSFELAEELKYS